MMALSLKNMYQNSFVYFVILLEFKSLILNFHKQIVLIFDSLDCDKINFINQNKIHLHSF